MAHLRNDNYVPLRNPAIPLLDKRYPVDTESGSRGQTTGCQSQYVFLWLDQRIHHNKIKPRHSQPARLGVSASGSPARRKMTTTKIAAFTLVEMSIVLIIIGLIVAGIAKGQSMIHNAKVMSVVSFIEQKKVAVRTFEMKYDALPGDMNNATDYWQSGAGTNGTVTSGNGDYKIEWAIESHMVWKHLYLAGLIDKNLTGVIGSQGHEPGVNIPETKLEGIGASLY